MHRRFAIALLGVAALLGPRPVPAEEPGRLRLRIVEASGHPIAFASVKLTATDEAPRDAATDLDGGVEFGDLWVGRTYTVDVSDERFHLRRDVRVDSGSSRVVEIVAHVRTHLPGGGGSVAGTAWLDPGPLTRPSLSGADPGRAIPATAGVSASVGAWFRSSELDGNGAHEEPRLDAPSFQTFRPWLRVTGGAGEDLTYRVALEGAKDERPVVIGGAIPNQTARDEFVDARLAWQVSPRNRVALEYRERSLELDRLGLSTTLPGDASPTLDLRSDELGLTWFAPVSGRTEVRGGVFWSERDERLFPTVRDPGNECVNAGAWPLSNLLAVAHCRNVPFQRSSGSYHRDVGALTERLDFEASVTWRRLRFLGAQHTLTVALATANDRLSYDSSISPSMEQNTLETYRDADSAADVPEPINLSVVSLPLSVDGVTRFKGTGWTFDLEDVFRPVEGWAIRVGARVLRTERSTDGWSSFYPAAEQTAFLAAVDAGADPQALLAGGIFTAYEGIDTLADDLGIAWRYPEAWPANQERPLLLQSADWPRRRIPESIELTTTDVSPYLSASWSPSGKDRFSLGVRRAHEPLTVEALSASRTQASYGEFVFSQRTFLRGVVPYAFVEGLDPQVSVRTLRRDLRSPFHDELQLGYERELTRVTRLGVRWTERRYRDQLRTRDANHLPGDFGRCQVVPSVYSNVRPLVESPGAGFELTDPFTGEAYLDSDPGVGDGRLDDCRGVTLLLPAMSEGDILFSRTFEQPDGRPDLYKQNPVWGSVIELGNSGRSDYESAVLEFEHGPADGWHLLASYTWSRHRGNYDRLATYDDFDPAYTPTDSGPQPEDRKHVIEVLARTDLGRNYRLGAHLTWRSGLPYTVFEQAWSYDAIPDAYEINNLVAARHRLLTVGGRNAARNRDVWRIDLLATRTLRLTGGVAVELSVAVDNLLDDGTWLAYNPDLGTGFQINGIADARQDFGRRYRLGAAAHW